MKKLILLQYMLITVIRPAESDTNNKFWKLKACSWLNKTPTPNFLEHNYY